MRSSQGMLRLFSALAVACVVASWPVAPALAQTVDPSAASSDSTGSDQGATSSASTVDAAGSDHGPAVTAVPMAASSVALPLDYEVQMRRLSQRKDIAGGA